MSTLSRINRLIGPQRSLSLNVFFALAASTIVFDQLAKLLMVAYFKPVIQHDPLGMPELVYARPPIVLIPDLFQFMYRINTGAAFSSLTGKTVFLTVVSIVISLGVLAWACVLKPGERGLRLSLGLIFGGAIGNLFDRLRLGYVIDFLDVHWREAYHYPTFNIADSAICVGIFLLFITSFTATQPTGAPQPAPAKSTEVS